MLDVLDLNVRSECYYHKIMSSNEIILRLWDYLKILFLGFVNYLELNIAFLESAFNYIDLSNYIK